MQTKYATAMTCYDNVFSLSSFHSILSSQKPCRMDSIDVSPHCTSIPGRALAGHVRRCTVLIGSQNSCGTQTHTHTLYTPVPTTFLSATFVHHLLSSTCSVFLYHPVWGYNALLSSIFLPSSELFFIDPWLFLRHWWQIAFEESLFHAYLAWVIIAFPFVASSASARHAAWATFWSCFCSCLWSQTLQCKHF